jgi:peptidoglycan/LPS O-acetylase OafA/YrhL
LPGIFDIPAFISAAWSLSYEWFFYLTIPLIVHGFQLHRWTRPSRMLFFAIAVTANFAIVLVFGSHFRTFQFQDGTRIRMIMFASGILVYEALESKRLRSLLTVPREYGLVAVAIACTASLLFMYAMKSAGVSADGEWTTQTGTLRVIPIFIGCAALGPAAPCYGCDRAQSAAARQCASSLRTGASVYARPGVSLFSRPIRVRRKAALTAPA